MTSKNTVERKKRQIWLQRMGIPQLFSFLIKGSFGRVRILYDEHRATPLAIRLLNIFKKMGLCGDFAPARLSLSQEDGARYRSFEKMLEDADACLENFCESYISTSELWYRQMVKSYLFSFLCRHFAFLAMVESGMKSGPQPEAREDTVVLLRTPFNLAIERFYSGRGFAIKETGLAEFTRHFLKPFYYLAAVFLNTMAPKGVRGNLDSKRPSVWVEWDPHSFFIDFAFWRHYIRTDDFDIVCYFDRSGEEPDDKVAREIETEGLRWVDFKFSQSLQLSGLRMRDAGRLFRKTNIAASRLPLWFRVFEFEYNFWFCIYEAVFRKFEVKILIHFQEASWKQAVQSKALESAGGVMVGYNWSNYYVPKMPSHLFPHHAYFIWGESIGAHMRSIKNVSRYILPSGLWLTEAEEIPAESGRLKKGLDFVMAIFDSSVSHSGIYSHVSLTRFYLDILRLLESNANWGGIIKNKNYDYSRLKDLPRGGEIISKINRLMKAERLIALGCSFSPLAAAARADLCVCYGFNSAGIVTGTCGYRTIHWDCSGISPRPFCDEADQKVIYGSYDDLEKAILRAASGDRTIGDFSKWSRNFNYFGDFLAPGRIALFIRSFMDEALKTGDADGALVAAVRKYIEDNGLEKKQENACVQNRLCTPSENVF